MADVKQILVVDDHFEMLEFLRSMLELSNVDCEVLAVPSAEEGFLEIRRAHFDLLITDVRLPGMSGFDLVRRIKSLGRSLPIIMITAYSSTQGKKEASELGIFKYFQKPLDTDNMLTAVHTALYGESTKPVISPSSSQTTVVVSAQLRKRVDALRADTGAVQLMLASNDGNVLLTEGTARDLDLNKMAAIIARNISDSFFLAGELGSTKPFTLQYHAGEKIELYCANVGENHFLAMFFDASSRRGRIGTIWVFTQRAIKDMQKMIPTSISEVEAVPTRDEQTEISEPETAVDDAPITLVPAEIEIPPPTLVEDTAVEETEVEPDYIDIDPGELEALLTGGSGGGDAADVDAFWDEAMSGESEEGGGLGFSFEEAQKRGLIATDPDEEKAD